MSRAEYLREWHKKHPEKNTEYCRRWQTKNRDERAKYFKEWRKRHPNHTKQVRMAEVKRRFRLIVAKGGKCELCGYGESFSALQFHHLNPEEKDSSWLKEKDLGKVMLVCANCHRVIHSQTTEDVYNRMRKGKTPTLKHKTEPSIRLTA